ncbi:hypothetical protein K493DRAFT_316102 [Basidiobolus meristosporus CBS 931.73]|uniref:SAP domain-containing protein n=1 Tax=Basidiobolus meristosporus CBS 931.73 TaxID=1314790 RepID=A0A1Y1Y5F9_9FUNG|nr:hypothetical protein K493DRAFT_316102 [Basidiobolus meristosporus CBS 931.73]|eukprot:ORX93247.1 hypothetical protein K493DRAFT_316102 [Basidiobolus meristosporus CBS 931.73]
MSSVDLNSLKKLKVAELKELLTKEGLSGTGKKEELLQRLSEHYKSKGLAQTEEDELPELAPPENFDWTESGLSNETSGDSNDPAIADATEDQLPGELTQPATPPKEDVNPPATTEPVNKDPSEDKENVEKEEKLDTQAKEVEDKEREANVAAELEKRRQRALRFGIPLSESTKVVERAMKFGTAMPDKKETKTSPLDLPLGEGQRDYRGQQGYRGRGRGRGGRYGQANPRNNLQIEPEKLQKRQERFGIVNNKAVSSAPIDPAEEERRKKRAERFGNMAQSQEVSPSKKPKPEA